jgi:nucleotide-binding universal stress UspA family protein
MYKRVLVATDGSELSEKAVSTAIDLALLTDA